MTPNKIELGCGANKRPGFFGIDIQPGPQVDLVLNIENAKLPFPDDSVDYIYSSHTFEHLDAPGSPIQVLRDIVRVSKHLATLEIWTPYGKSNDGFLFGHRNFYTETHWKHICFEYDSFYLGHGPGRFLWVRTQYVLFPGILESLSLLNIPLDFAIEHMFNIVLEFGIFLTVDKTRNKAESPQFPKREFGYRRGETLNSNTRNERQLEVKEEKSKRYLNSRPLALAQRLCRKLFGLTEPY